MAGVVDHASGADDAGFVLVVDEFDNHVAVALSVAMVALVAIKTVGAAGLVVKVVDEW